jgi:hypothetical protein
MDWLREHSARRGQRMCGMSAMVDEVTVQRGPNGVHFGGLLTCGSRTCPNCGPRIAAQTRRDLEEAITAWTGRGPGHRILFGTFTIRHAKGQAFSELAAGVSACWKAATGGRGWMNDRMQHGIEHHVRIFEEKLSTVNGWHIHVHVLFLVRHDLAVGDPQELLGSMFKRWARQAVALNLGVPLLRAQDVHTVTGAEALERVAGYFAKQTTDAGDRTAPALAAEMSNAAGKQGLTSLTPGQLLAWAMHGDDYVDQLWGPAKPGARGRGIQGREYARYLYREYEVGMKGRRAIAWSRGMREDLGLGRELTDAELAERQEQADTATAETLVSMTGPAWRKLAARPGRRAELYAVAATLTRHQLVEWLAGHGVHASPHRRDRDLDIDVLGVRFTEETPF